MTGHYFLAFDPTKSPYRSRIAPLGDDAGLSWEPSNAEATESEDGRDSAASGAGGEIELTSVTEDGAAEVTNGEQSQHHTATMERRKRWLWGCIPIHPDSDTAHWEPNRIDVQFLGFIQRHAVKRRLRHPTDTVQAEMEDAFNKVCICPVRCLAQRLNCIFSA